MEDDTALFRGDAGMHDNLSFSEVDATPVAKQIFLGYTRGGYDFFDAVAEYVDNAIEQARIGKRSNKVKVVIEASYNGSEFVVSIKDNAGGCPLSSALLFIRPGNTGLSPVENGISRFGIGGKAAGLSVAKRVVIESRYAGERGFRVVLDKGEILNKDDWKFKVFDLKQEQVIEEGCTLIKLEGVDSETHARYPNEYVRRFSERYGLMLGPEEPKVFIGKDEIVPTDPFLEMLNADEAPENCSPLTKRFKKSYPVKMEGKESAQSVDMTITVGLLPERSTIGRAGAKIYCNRRLIGHYHELGLLEGTGIEDRRVHPGQDQSWLRSIVLISGPSELMPWTNRKDSLDRSAPVYKDLERNLAYCYSDFLENQVYKQKESLRSESGIKEFPTIYEILVDGYIKKIQSGALDPRAVRSVVQSTKAFKDAANRQKVNRPTPPEEKNIIQLNASVEKGKVIQAKKLIKKLYGFEEVKNTDVVRTAIDHFIECKGKDISDGRDEE